MKNKITFTLNIFFYVSIFIGIDSFAIGAKDFSKFYNYTIVITDAKGKKTNQNFENSPLNKINLPSKLWDCLVASQWDGDHTKLPYILLVCTHNKTNVTFNSKVDCISENNNNSVYLPIDKGLGEEIYLDCSKLKLIK